MVGDGVWAEGVLFSGSSVYIQIWKHLQFWMENSLKKQRKNDEKNRNDGQYCWLVFAESR